MMRALILLVVAVGCGCAPIDQKASLRKKTPTEPKASSKDHQEAVKTVEVTKKAGTEKKSEAPPKKAEAAKKVEAPKKAEAVKKVEEPKKAEATKNVEASVKVEAPKK